MEQDSIFTKIIKGELPSYKVYEDNKSIAILDINPLAEGHVLLIPKQQVDSLWDLDNETYAHLFEKAKVIAEKIQSELKPQRVGVVVEGFSVPHAHIHLVPLYDEGILVLSPNRLVDNSAENMTKIAAKIAQETV